MATERPCEQKDLVTFQIALKFREVLHCVKTVSRSILVCLNEDSSILSPYVLPLQFLFLLVYFTEESLLIRRE